MKGLWGKKTGKTKAPAGRGWKILLVCMGNICRSPLAEGVLRQRVAEAGLTAELQCDSAGTQGYHAGEAPDVRAQQVARESGMDIGNLRARRVMAADFRDFDWVLAMDRHNLSVLTGECPLEYRHKLQLFLEFAGEAGAEVPDPYYGSIEGFHEVLSRCERGAAGVIARYRAYAEQAPGH